MNTHSVNTDTLVARLGGKHVTRTNLITLLGVKYHCSLVQRTCDHMITKTRKVLSAMKVIEAANTDQRLLILESQGLVLAAIEYILAIFTISPEQIKELENMQNKAVRIILGTFPA